MRGIDERPPARELNRDLNRERVPTLTEVVELGVEPSTPADAAPPLQPQPGHPPEPDPGSWRDETLLLDAPQATPAAQPVLPDAADLVAQVLAELLPGIDLRFEARLREARAPALARAADSLVRDSRHELGALLQGMVEEAVARALRAREGG